MIVFPSIFSIFLFSPFLLSLPPVAAYLCLHLSPHFILDLFLLLLYY